MPSMNSTSPAPVSTSTPAAPSTTSETKLVRAKRTALRATRATREQQIELVNGTVVFVRLGDWLVSQGTHVVQVCGPTHLSEYYEDVQEGLLLPAAVCTTIENRTGIGTTKTADALVQAIARLATIAIGDVSIPFTPGQLEEIKHRAAKRGYTVEQELQRIIDRIKDELFYHS